MLDLVLLPLMTVVIGAGVISAIRLEASDPSLQSRPSTVEAERR